MEKWRLGRARKVVGRKARSVAGGEVGVVTTGVSGPMMLRKMVVSDCGGSVVDRFANGIWAVALEGTIGQGASTHTSGARIVIIVSVSCEGLAYEEAAGAGVGARAGRPQGVGA